MRTRDIYFTAFLIEEGNIPIDFTKNGHIVEFVFDIDDEQLKKLKLKYMSSKQNEVKTQIEKIKGLY